MFKVYVGNLDSRVTADSLRPMFEPFGDLDEIIIATDSKTQKSRGFAIVLFRDPMKGQLAIETLAGRKVNGRTIIISEALKKGKPASRTPGKPMREGPFGPRFGSARGGVGGRRFSSRNPRRGSAGGFGSRGPGSPTGGSSTGPASAPGSGPASSPPPPAPSKAPNLPPRSPGARPPAG